MLSFPKYQHQNSFILLGFLCIFSPTILFAENPPCAGESGTNFTNYLPNGTTELGGFVSELAEIDNSSKKIYIGPQATVCGNSQISGSVRLEDQAKVVNASISDEVVIKNQAIVADGAQVSGHVLIKDSANVYGNVSVSDHATIAEQAVAYNPKAATTNSSNPTIVTIFDRATIRGNAEISNNAVVFEDAVVEGDAKVSGGFIGGTAIVSGEINWTEGTIIHGKFDGQKQEEEAAVAPVVEPVVEDEKPSDSNLLLTFTQLLTAGLHNYPNVPVAADFAPAACGILIKSSGWQHGESVEHLISYGENNSIENLISYMDQDSSNDLVPVNSKTRQGLIANFQKNGGKFIMQIQTQVSKSVSKLTLYYFSFTAQDANKLIEISRRLEILCGNNKNPDQL